MRALRNLAVIVALAACSSKGPPGAPLPASHWDDPAWRLDAGSPAFDLGAPTTDARGLDGAAEGDASQDVSAPADVSGRDGASADATLSCGPGLTACGDACYDTQRSSLHCGSCSNACALQSARSTCAMGRCAVDLCFAGYADCDGRADNGCEVHIESDPGSCGACGRACPAPQVCSNGACASACATGVTQCGRACVTTSMNASHCGACGRACEPTAGGVVSCRSGACAITCAGARGDCDGLVESGCEVDTSSDPQHCGRCGAACPVGGNTDPLCVNGACRFRCRAGFEDCDGNPANGCEAELSSDLHCGRCGRACGAGLLCADGECVSGCAAGRERCGGACVDLATSPTNCGACGVVCRLGERCLEGACASGAPPRSCGVADLDTCAQVEVPGGTMRMGSETRDLTLRRFAIDAYEVTVGRFRRFWANRPAALPSIRATPVTFPGGQTVPWTLTASAPATTAGCNWTTTATTPERERHPINCVDWTLAMEFCVWDGGRLPTEAEWEFVARAWRTAGLAAGRTFPWGSHDPTAEDIASMMMPDPDGGLGCPYAHWGPCRGQDGRRTRRVGLGLLGAPAGIYDLAGNVGEWTANSVASYGDACWTGRADNPLCVGTSSLRVWRGGAYDAVQAFELRGAERPGLFADQSLATVGFRCARTR